MKWNAWQSTAAVKGTADNSAVVTWRCRKGRCEGITKHWYGIDAVQHNLPVPSVASGKRSISCIPFVLRLWGNEEILFMNMRNMRKWGKRFSHLDFSDWTNFSSSHFTYIFVNKVYGMVTMKVIHTAPFLPILSQFTLFKSPSYYQLSLSSLRMWVWNYSSQHLKYR